MQYLRIKNFEEFQHYKDRKPPWIKLYRTLWGDPEFFRLRDSAKAHLIGLFALASHHDNKIEFDKNWIKHEIAATERVDYDALFASGFVMLTEDASNMLASCKRNAHLEENIKQNIKQESRDTARSDADASSAPPPILSMPLAGGTEFHVTAAHLAEFSKLYPGVDPEQELLKAKGWLIANPTRRKTPRGIARFLHGWLSRAQDRGNGNGANPHKESTLDFLNRYEQEKANGIKRS